MRELERRRTGLLAGAVQRKSRSEGEVVQMVLARFGKVREVLSSVLEKAPAEAAQYMCLLRILIREIRVLRDGRAFVKASLSGLLPEVVAGARYDNHARLFRVHERSLVKSA